MNERMVASGQLRRTKQEIMADWRICLLVIVAIAGITGGQDDGATTITAPSESTETTTPAGNGTTATQTASSTSTTGRTSTTTTTTTTEPPTTTKADDGRPPEFNRTDFLTGRFCTCDLALGSCDVGCCCDEDCDLTNRQGGPTELGLEMPAHSIRICPSLFWIQSCWVGYMVARRL